MRPITLSKKEINELLTISNENYRGLTSTAKHFNAMMGYATTKEDKKRYHKIVLRSRDRASEELAWTLRYELMLKNTK